MTFWWQASALITTLSGTLCQIEINLIMGEHKQWIGGILEALETSQLKRPTEELKIAI
jgi:hypothetical protein